MAEESALLARLRGLAEERGAHLAVIDEHERVSFRQLLERSERIAAALLRRGHGGARVALLVTQGARWVEGFLGVLAAGGVVVPLSPLHPQAEQRWFIERSGATVALGCEALGEPLRAWAPVEVLGVEALRQEARAEQPLPRPASGEAALILYTSGTTGKPKGALISHDNLAAVARLLGSAWQWRPEDVLLHALPLHHLHGLGIALFTALLAGSTTVMRPRFDAAELWELCAEGTVLMGVPTMHKRLLDALDAAPPESAARWRRNAAGLRLVTSGSAALPRTVGERWRALSGDYPLERFGMTEIGVGLSNPVDGERVAGSCGLPLPGMDVRLVGEDGREVAPGEPGEIWIRGPGVFLGYDGDEAATRAAFTEGWFRSGDLATRDERGYVKILGRLSVDILKSGGYKLSALEIEEVLRDHPAVADAAVVGLPDETWGELVVAALLPRPGRAAELSEEAVRAFAKERIAAYKVPKRVVVLEQVPRNPVGKVVKPELAKLLAARFAAEAGAGAGPS